MSGDLGPERFESYFNDEKYSMRCLLCLLALYIGTGTDRLNVMLCITAAVGANAHCSGESKVNVV